LNRPTTHAPSLPAFNNECAFAKKPAGLGRKWQQQSPSESNSETTKRAGPFTALPDAEAERGRGEAEGEFNSGRRRRCVAS